MRTCETSLKNMNDQIGETQRKWDREGLDALARQHGFSAPAVAVMREALVRGDGKQAQFNHFEFGGTGQWMQGGMIMIGDMFNNALKSRVNSLCRDLSEYLARPPPAGKDASANAPHAQSEQGGAWWPADLTTPTITGCQNAVRYAYFAAACRLVIDNHGHIVVYDSQDHRISGVSQHQSSDGSLSFCSQHGAIDLSRLPVM